MSESQAISAAMTTLGLDPTQGWQPPSLNEVSCARLPLGGTAFLADLCINSHHFDLRTCTAPDFAPLPRLVHLGRALLGRALQQSVMPTSLKQAARHSRLQGPYMIMWPLVYLGKPDGTL